MSFFKELIDYSDNEKTAEEQLNALNDRYHCEIVGFHVFGETWRTKRTHILVKCKGRGGF